MVYGALALNAVALYLSSGDGVVTDPSGATWSLSALTETMMTVNLFTVLPAALLALRGGRPSTRSGHPGWVSPRRDGGTRG